VLHVLRRRPGPRYGHPPRPPPPYDNAADVREATRGKTKEEVRSALGEPDHSFRRPRGKDSVEVWMYHFGDGRAAWVHFGPNGKVVKVD
jgi:hypothetical protein